MRRLFRSFDRFRVDYLLISGQASILYGAATFSEDVDIWLRPTLPNARRLLRALASQRARVYKLTPPLTFRNMRFGHGFHFTLPRGTDTLFLDVMATPPRVGPFGEARRKATLMRGPFGAVPVVSVPDLVELKKTQRFVDYDVISNLVARVARTGDVPKPILRWAARNSFRAGDRAAYRERLGQEGSEERSRADILQEIGRLQTRDVVYWRRIVRDLRRLRRDGKLLAAGTPVARLASAP